jgi:hypothetical protein
VTAAGTAVCVASATANAQKTRLVSGTASAKATVALAPKRTATAHPQLVHCTAVGSGRGATQFWSVSGVLLALAQVSGRSRVDFVAAASIANAYGQANVKPLRRARAYPRQAQAFAALDGQGYIFELAHPGPARATAWGFGTTYQTGQGEALATSAITGKGAWASGGAGHAVAEVTASADWNFTAGGQGIGAGTATARADAAVRREGIRYFEVIGVAEAAANALITTLAIYQSQTAHAYAHLVQSSIQTRGARGLGKAYATAIADALTVGTGATLIIGDTHAFASGRAQFTFGGRGVGTSRAVGSGAPTVRSTKNYGAPAAAMATASAAGIVRNTKVYPDTAYGVATLSGRLFRVVTVYGVPVNASATAVDTAFIRTRVAVGVALAKAALAANATRTQYPAGEAGAEAAVTATTSVGVKPQPAVAKARMTLVPVRGVSGIAHGTARAALSGDATVRSTKAYPGTGYGAATLSGRMFRTTKGHGTPAAALATALGYNQVNDLLRAPAVRTVVVEAAPRLFEVPAENRLLAA